MEVQSYELNVLLLQCGLDGCLHVIHGNTKLILCQSGSDVSMCMCSHVRVYAETYACGLALGSSQLVYYAEFLK